MRITASAKYLLLGVPVLLMTILVRAGGIEVPMQAARASGQADAFTAQADDASAIFYNPAGLTQLRGTNISAGIFLLQPIFDYHGAGDTHGEMRLPSILPHIYAESDFGLKQWRFGMGVNNVYGLNEDYGATSPTRTLVNQAQLQVINFAPTAAYQIDEHFSVGAALNVYYGDLKLRRNVTLGAPPTPEGDFNLRGNDYAFGVTPGVMWKIDERQTLGAYYRSPFSLDFDGKARLFVPGGKVGPSSTHESISFPQSVGLGYALRPTPPLKLEADVIWTDWHSVDKLQLHSSNPAFNGQTIPANWKSGFTFRLGGQYNITPEWVIRGGYAFSQNAVPASTFSPLVPDANYHLIAIGTGYSTQKWSLDAAYQFIYRERRHIANNVASPTVDGTWDNIIHGLMLTLTFKL